MMTKKECIKKYPIFQEWLDTGLFFNEYSDLFSAAKLVLKDKNVDNYDFVFICPGSSHPVKFSCEGRDASFEDFFNRAPIESQEKMIYHFDLFLRINANDWK